MLVLCLVMLTLRRQQVLESLLVQPNDILYTLTYPALHLYPLMFSLYNVLFVSTVEKMKNIDKEYENLSSSGDKLSSVESKLSAYRKEIEAQAQAEMNTKVFSTTESAVKVYVKWFIIQILRFYYLVKCAQICVFLF